MGWAALGKGFASHDKKVSFLKIRIYFLTKVKYIHIYSEIYRFLSVRFD